ncbi:hypothetical protein [Halorubellus sp. PRR65]|uniref:hypothetical protein n=1 Tax=Halorubellus sp. PRR65 TaxID=3098148 RepID=UPI002B25F5AD|nr:hypothetical protein [Halorubellus sp. PRR65]
MNALVLLAGVGSLLLGVPYVAAPRRVYHFGFESLRAFGSGPSEPSDGMLWMHRFVGLCSLVTGILYIIPVL